MVFFINWEKFEKWFFFVDMVYIELYIIFIYILRKYFFLYVDEWICGKILKKCCYGN